jgi:hypothetical protein
LSALIVSSTGTAALRTGLTGVSIAEDDTHAARTSAAPMINRRAMRPLQTLAPP